MSVLIKPNAGRRQRKWQLQVTTVDNENARAGIVLVTVGTKVIKQLLFIALWMTNFTTPATSEK